MSESPRNISFCTHAIQQDEVLWIADAREDPRFVDSPLVASGPRVRFYAGAPILSGGHRVGTVCVLDFAPRPFDAGLATVLQDLARMAADQLELRQLRAAEAVSKNLTASTSDAVICADQTGAITLWNRGAETTFGWSADEAVGRPLHIIIPPALQSAHSAGFARVIGSGSPRLIGKTVEVPAIHKDGRELPMELTLSTWTSGEGRFVGAICRDVSERKRAEEAVRRSRDEEAAAKGESAAAYDTMRLLVRSATTCLVMTDRDLRVIDVSDRWTETYGRARETVLGSTMHEVFPSSRERWQPIYSRCLAGARERGDLAVSAEDGAGQRWFQWEIAPWRDASGQVAGLLLTNHEVTALVAAKEAAESSQAETRRAHQAAEAANRVKDEFLANMSHEIRTPLNGVLGLSGVLALTPLTPDQAEMVATIEDSGRELERMLTGVLELVRLDAGEAELKPERIDLDRLLADVSEARRAEAAIKGLVIKIKRTGDRRAALMGDGGRIRGVLDRLLENAIKFTEHGSILLTLDLQQSGDRVRARFGVRDTGIGFDPDQAERLFDRFRQADGSATRRFGGSGLGLAVCRSMAAAMGGDIEAWSKPGEGSAFTLVLELEPLADGAVQPAAAPRAVRVLLAEDHPTNRTVVELILGGIGVELTCVENGAEAVSAAEAADFDLILMDMQMPVMDGLSAIRAIREREASGGGGRTPVYTLTANALPEHRAAALAAGADEHLTKPISAARLIASVARAAGQPLEAAA
jgi:PAS domain S-box-containing protein